MRNIFCSLIDPRIYSDSFLNSEWMAMILSLLSILDFNVFIFPLQEYISGPMFATLDFK